MIDQKPFFGTWNDENKTFWLGEMQDHQDADRLVQGLWFAGGKGCFFGCAMQTKRGALEAAIEAMGLPEWLIHLAEAIYEGLPEAEALTFPVRLLKAIPTDTDLTLVLHATAIMRLAKLSENHESVRSQIDAVIALHARAIAGNEVTEEEWWIAENGAAQAAQLESALFAPAQTPAVRAAAKSAAWPAQSAVRSAELSTQSAAMLAAVRSAVGIAADRAALAAEDAQLPPMSAAALASKLAEIGAGRRAGDVAFRHAMSEAWSAEAKNLIAAMEQLNDKG